MTASSHEDAPAEVAADAPAEPREEPWYEAHRCPDGASFHGEAPPDGDEAWCALDDGTMHGPSATWGRGGPSGRAWRRVAQYDRGSLREIRISYDDGEQLVASGMDDPSGRVDRRIAPDGVVLLEYRYTDHAIEVEARYTGGGLRSRGRVPWYLPRHETWGPRSTRPVGTWTYWDPGGRELGAIDMDADRVVFRRWHANGQLEAEAEYRDGVPNGRRRHWYADGQLWLEGGHDEFGERHGMHTLYRADGSKAERGPYRAGVPVGRWRWWHPNGTLHAEATYTRRGTERVRIYDEAGKLVSRDPEDFFVTASANVVVVSEGPADSVAVTDERSSASAGDNARTVRLDGAVLAGPVAPPYTRVPRIPPRLGPRRIGEE